MTQHRMFQQII